MNHYMERIDAYVCSLIADNLTYKDVVSLAKVTDALTPAYLYKRSKMVYQESLDIISSIFIIRRDYGKKSSKGAARYEFNSRLQYGIEYTNSKHIKVLDRAYYGFARYKFYNLSSILKSEKDRGAMYVHSIAHEYLRQILMARRDNDSEMEFMMPVGNFAISVWTYIYGKGTA